MSELEKMCIPIEYGVKAYMSIRASAHKVIYACKLSDHAVEITDTNDGKIALTKIYMDSGKYSHGGQILTGQYTHDEFLENLGITKIIGRYPSAKAECCLTPVDETAKWYSKPVDITAMFDNGE